MPKFDAVALALFFLLLAVYLFTASGHAYAADEETIIYVTAGILRRDDFAVPHEDAPTLGMMRGTDGRYYSQTGIAPSLIAAPFFGVGEAFSKFSPARFNGFWTRFGVITFLNPLVTALTATLLYCLIVGLGYSRRSAVITALAFGLATSVWWFTKTAFTEPLAALLLLISFAGIFYFQKTRARAWLLVSGFAFGFALMTRFQLLVAAPVFAMYLVWAAARKREWRRLAYEAAVWGAPIFAAWLLIAWYNWTRFGSPFEAGYSAYARLLGMPRLEWIYGLLFSPGKSLFWYSPPLLAGVIGLGWFGKKFPRETFLIVTFAVSQILFYGGYGFWHGDSGWGPRFLVPTIPFLMLPFAETLTRARVRWFAYLAIAVGFVVQIPSLFVNTNTVVLLAPDKKPWDTLWMTDWTSAPILANWNLFWARLTMNAPILPALPPLPNDRFIWFNEPSILHRADVWWWYLPNTQMEASATALVMLLLGCLIAACVGFGARQVKRNMSSKHVE